MTDRQTDRWTQGEYDMSADPSRGDILLGWIGPDHPMKTKYLKKNNRNTCVLTRLTRIILTSFLWDSDKQFIYLFIYLFIYTIFIEGDTIS